MSARQPFESQGMRLIEYLFSNGKKIFTTGDAVQAAVLYQIPQGQINKILSNLTKRRFIIRLRRGLYAGVGLLPRKFDTHPFVLSAFLVQPSMISHWSALHHHGFTEQIPYVITASTPRKVVTPSMRHHKSHDTSRKHAWEINDVRYEYISIRQKNFFGFETIQFEEGLYARITDKERTVLDLFAYPYLFGGMGEVLGIVEQLLDSINISKLVEYAKKYSKKSAIKRLGWSLTYFGISKKMLAPLLALDLGYYCCLDPSLPAVGAYDQEWMIQNNLVR